MTRAGVAIFLTALAVVLGGCQSNVKGSWACAVDRGGVCASITDIDHMPARGSSPAQHASILADPVVDGAIPAKLWGEGGWTTGALAGAPVRQSDQVMKVAVALHGSTRSATTTPAARSTRSCDERTGMRLGPR